MKSASVSVDAARLLEPGAEGRLVQCPSEPAGDLVPQALSSQLGWVFHPVSGLLSTRGEARAYQRPSGRSTGARALSAVKNRLFCRDFRVSTRVSTPVENVRRERRGDPCEQHFRSSPGLWISGSAKGPSILPPSLLPGPGGSDFEPSDVKRTYQPNVAAASASTASARACRPGPAGDPQAPPGQGPQAALGVSASAPVQRRHRLSRSRDFDAVYRRPLGVDAIPRPLLVPARGG